MRNLLLILLFWLLGTASFAQETQTNNQKSTSFNLADTATMNALKDSMSNRIGQIFDVDMLMQCLQVRQISSIGFITLLTKNKALADTVNKFQKDYEVNLMVHSYINSKQFWPNLLFNKDKLSDWTSDIKNKPGVGFDIKFTPQGTGWLTRKFKADIGNGATAGLLDSVKLKKVETAENVKLGNPYTSIPRDTINQAVYKGIGVLRGMFKEQTDQCNISQVTFTSCNGQAYGFDVLPNDALRSYYDQLTIKGRPYETPWKSVAVRSTDSVRIKIEKADKNSPTHKVQFRSSTGSNLVLRQNADGTFLLSLNGRSNKDEETIEAYYIDTLPTQKTKEYVIGKLKIISYTPVKKKLTPIILNGAKFAVDKDALKKALNDIYKQAAVEWEVNTPVAIDVDKGDWDLDENGILKIETSPFSRYSDAMQVIIDVIKKNVTPDPEAYYVVITDLPNNLSYKGYMPLKAECAFLFINSSTNDAAAYHTIAHELAHGTFYLRHIEDEYKITTATNNLMDSYAGGNELWKPQWDWIGDPSFRLYMFQKESDGALISCGTSNKPENIRILLQKLKTCESDVDDLTAKLTDSDMSKYLCAQERKDLIKCIANGTRVGTEDEQSIIRLIKTTPLIQKNELIGLIEKESKILKNLHSSIDGDELTEYYKELIILYRLSKTKEFWDNITKNFDKIESGQQKKTVTEWAKLKVFFWLDVGIIDYITEGRIVYNNEEIKDNNRLKFDQYTSYLTWSLNELKNIDLGPFEVIRLHFLSESEQLGIPKGEYADIPAIALRFLIQKQFNRDSWTAVNTAFVIGTMGSGGLATLWGKVDCVLGLGAILEDNYHNRLTKTPEGRVVINAWKILNVALLIRLGYKVTVTIPTAWKSLSEAIAKLRIKDPALANEVENEAKQAFSAYNVTGEVVEVFSSAGKLIGKYSKGEFLEIISTGKPLYGGNIIKLTDAATTTVTGVLDNVNTIATRGQIIEGITKMGANQGGINILRSPQWAIIQAKYKSILEAGDELGYWKKVTDEFWNVANKPWLDEAIARGDQFRFVSDPTLEEAIYVTKGKNFVLDNLGHKIRSIFGREIEYLKSNGYTILSDGTAVK
jgi:hypothetical protein